VLAVGDKIEVYIKDFDPVKRRISLGYRDENENPWTKFLNETKEGDIVDAKILNTMPFGAFAEVVPGVDGLIHISQIVNKKISKPSEVLNIGDVVQVKITAINPEARQVALSMRALLEPEESAFDSDEEEAGTETEIETEAVAVAEVEIEAEAEVEAVAEIAETKTETEAEIETATETE
jgi:4-hydroxy-3-methylbut-2-enyl diphosphate reductase